VGNLVKRDIHRPINHLNLGLSQPRQEKFPLYQRDMGSEGDRVTISEPLPFKGDRVGADNHQPVASGPQSNQHIGVFGYKRANQNKLGADGKETGR